MVRADRFCLAIVIAFATLKFSLAVDSDHIDSINSDSMHTNTQFHNSTEASHHEQDQHQEDEEEHHSEEEEHHGDEEEHHEEEHHVSRHAVIWPSAVAMMIFIFLSGTIFFKLYNMQHMKKMMKKQHDFLFYETAVANTALTGIAAPGLAGHKEKHKNSVKSKTTAI